MKKLSAIFTAVFLTIAQSLFATPLQLDYYGVISSSADSNMLKMAQDFFFTQINAIDGVSVQDKRQNPGTVLTSVPDTSSTHAPKIAFYAEISEDKKDESAVFWNCIFFAGLADSLGGTTYQKSKNYDSYYKMLTNSKDTIHELLDAIKIKTSENGSLSASSKNSAFAQKSFNIEKLSGIWSGEPFTDKIVILRGGRGFIIFKNGATMNISVSAEENSEHGSLIKIRQIGKPNASFYPELPREIALSVAPNASPIEWNFTMNDENALSGTKTTLLQDDSKAEKVKAGNQSVTWYKK